VAQCDAGIAARSAARADRETTPLTDKVRHHAAAFDSRATAALAILRTMGDSNLTIPLVIEPSSP
jgi:hypothetical protein